MTELENEIQQQQNIKEKNELKYIATGVILSFITLMALIFAAVIWYYGKKV